MSSLTAKDRVSLRSLTFLALFSHFNNFYFREAPLVLI